MKLNHALVIMITCKESIVWLIHLVTKIQALNHHDIVSIVILIAVTSLSPEFLGSIFIAKMSNNS